MILITNDDGIDSEGLHILGRYLSRIAPVYVVAPSQDCSGKSHSITTAHPLRITKRLAMDYSGHIYAVDGTPADCTAIAFDHILPQKPRWVVSGINKGGNLGDDTLYSGTVAAAMESVMKSVPAIAVSSHRVKESSYCFETAAQIVCDIITNYPADAALFSARPFILNINVPALEKIKGVRSAVLGCRLYERYEERVDPNGRRYYWIGPWLGRFQDIPHSDCSLVSQGYASVTVLKPSFFDQTLHDHVLSFLPSVEKDYTSSTGVIDES